MRSDFAIYILSHKRAEDICTVRTLRECGYSGKIYVVIDDEDDVHAYRQHCISEELLIFHKDDYIGKYDSMDNLGKRNIAFYARNFINEHAALIGLTYFGQFDDDIDGLYYRYVDSANKFKRVPIIDADKVLSEYLDFMDSSDKIYGCCFALDSGFFGGANGKFKDGLGRRMYQTMLLKTAGAVPWVGSHYEDMLLSTLNFSRLYFDSYQNSFSSPKMASNSGGIDYDGLFGATVYAKVGLGEKLTLKEDGKTVVRSDYLFPKIISSRFKI